MGICSLEDLEAGFRSIKATLREMGHPTARAGAGTKSAKGS